MRSGANFIDADSETEERVELHLHTSYSAMDALTDVSEAIRKAAEWGHPAIAITDHGSAQAFPAAQRAARNYGIKVIYGLEGYFVNDIDGEDPAEVHHVTLLVKNKAGLKNLYELISQSYLTHNHEYPLIPKSLLLRHREGLLIGSACESGEVFRAVERHKSNNEAVK